MVDYSKSFEDLETIDMILNEANAYNVRKEVEFHAQYLTFIGHTEVKAYQHAFNYVVYIKPYIKLPN